MPKLNRLIAAYKLKIDKPYGEKTTAEGDNITL